MVSLNIDVSDFIDRANELGAQVDQLPFALSRAMNDAADYTLNMFQTETWPTAVTMRNASFIRAALTTRGARATKDDLSVYIYDKLGRASLDKHADGGLKLPKRSALAIPLGDLSRNRSGALRNQNKPKNLQGKFERDGILYQVTGRGSKRKIMPMYVLKPRANIAKDVPFREDFARFMSEALTVAFPIRMMQALETRRAR